MLFQSLFLFLCFRLLVFQVVDKYILKMMFHLMLIYLFVALYLSYLPHSSSIFLSFFSVFLFLPPTHCSSFSFYLHLSHALTFTLCFSQPFFSLSLFLPCVTPTCIIAISSALIFTHRLRNKVSLEFCNLRYQFFEQIFIENQAKLIVMLGGKLNRNGVFYFLILFWLQFKC